MHKSTSTLSQGAMHLESNMLSGLQKIISLNNYMYNKQDFLKCARNAKEPDKDKGVFIRYFNSNTRIYKKKKSLENAKQRLKIKKNPPRT